MRKKKIKISEKLGWVSSNGAEKNQKLEKSWVVGPLEGRLGKIHHHVHDFFPDPPLIYHVF